MTLARQAGHEPMPIPVQRVPRTRAMGTFPFDAARKQGARRVRFQDREFEFDSVDDYLKLRNLILNDIAQQSGPQQVRQVRIYTTNGWGH